MAFDVGYFGWFLIGTATLTAVAAAVVFVAQVATKRRMLMQALRIWLSQPHMTLLVAGIFAVEGVNYWQRDEKVFGVLLCWFAARRLTSALLTIVTVSDVDRIKENAELLAAVHQTAREAARRQPQAERRILPL